MNATRPNVQTFHVEAGGNADCGWAVFELEPGRWLWEAWRFDERAEGEEATRELSRAVARAFLK